MNFRPTHTIFGNHYMAFYITDIECYEFNQDSLYTQDINKLSNDCELVLFSSPDWNDKNAPTLLVSDNDLFDSLGNLVNEKVNDIKVF